MKVKFIKRIVTLLMCLTLALSMAACGNKSDNKSDNKSKTMTAEEVIEKALSAEGVANMKMDMAVKVDMGMNLKQMMLDQGATEADIQAAIDGGMVTEESLNMNIVVDMALAMEVETDKYYMTGDFKMNVAGESMDQTVETYAVKESDDTVTTYTYDTDDECWYKTTSESDDEATSELAGLLSSMGEYKDYIKSSKIVSNKDGVYTVDVTLDLAKLMSEDVTDALDDMLGDMASTVEGMYDSMDEMTMTIKVDGESGALLGLYVDCADMIKDALAAASGDAADYSEYITVKECTIELTASNHGKVKVTIPDEVLEAEEDDSLIDLGDDEDDYSDSGSTVVVEGNCATLFDLWDEKEICKVYIPDDFVLDTEYSDATTIVMNYKDEDAYASLWVSPYPSTWAEDIMEGGVHELDTEWYITDSVEKLNQVILTTQGTAEVYQRTWSMTEGDEYIDYCVVLPCGVDSYGDALYASFEVEADALTETGYTLEQLVQAVFGK